MRDFLEKLDQKTIIALFVFIFMGVTLSDKYASKHLLAKDEKIKKIIMESTDGKKIPFYSRKSAKHRIIYSISPDCTFCGFQKTMIDFAFKFISNDQWEIMPVAFDFASKDLIRAYKAGYYRTQTVYVGNEQIKKILKIQQHPSIYFITSNGYVYSRSALPSTFIGILYNALQIEEFDENDKPILHRI